MKKVDNKPKRSLMFYYLIALTVLIVGDFMSCHQTAHTSCHWIAPFSGNGNL